MLILRPAWLHTARQPYLVSVTPAALGDFPPHVCVSRLFSVCAKGKKKVMCSACFGKFKNIPCMPLSLSRAGVEGWGTASGRRARLLAGFWWWGKERSESCEGEWEECSGLFFRGVAFYSLLLPFAPLLSSLPWDRNPGPRNQQHKPLRLKPFWLQNLLWITWVSCSLFHLCLYSLFLTIHNKTWSQELEDKLVCQSWLTLEAHWC